MGQFVLHTEIPNEIGFLTRLTFLSNQSYLDVIPTSIGNLSNLETLIADFQSYGDISFPHTLWNLQKLKYLHIGCREDGFTLPNENVENSSVLLELKSLSGVVFSSDGSMGRQMRMFPNIRRLSCCILPGVEGAEKMVLVPQFLRQLESLTITGKGKLQYEFGSTDNLRKLQLNGFELSREDIEAIGEFPKLEVLKMKEIYYDGGILQMEEGEFVKLRYLKLHEHYYSGNLERWVASDDQLPNLKKLVLESCSRLKEIPSCLDTILSLEEIESSGCSLTVKSLVRGIREAQRDWGNSIKAHITPEEEE